MAEPTTTAAAVATLSGSAIAVPVISLLGTPLGLRLDVLFAGFSGALFAIGLLNSVPSTGDTLWALLETSARRLFVAVISSLAAGYLTPMLLVAFSLPDAVFLSAAFLAGCGAQKFVQALLNRFLTDQPSRGGSA